ncbi:DUF397 domain-containing protein [Streptomyces sp. XM4193]|uniref:DUF397 domain-containing protein n=1 Tax=Streptomyces sp. XM4193 TaxID=2929782 RepID=UPI001FF97F7B|nr:DUF397 domain-containing protein [Streptomyces sp. XM4193]MCK1795785.1 DUF397 domain-containing protein [Streptomyces sp. XM4193]
MHTGPDLTHVTWRKSSHSNQDGGECLEIADGHSGVLPVRDSKNPAGPGLVFSTTEWDAFVSAVKAGDFTG